MRDNLTDGATTKLLFRLCDGQRVEGCILHYGRVEYENFPGERARPHSPCMGISNSNKRSNGSQREFSQIGESKWDENDSLPLPVDATSGPMRRFRSNPRSTLCVSSQVRNF